jgi:hypothetical protein
MNDTHQRRITDRKHLYPPFIYCIVCGCDRPASGTWHVQTAKDGTGILSTGWVCPMHTTDANGDK